LIKENHLTGIYFNDKEEILIPHPDKVAEEHLSMMMKQFLEEQEFQVHPVKIL
jgi:hypothetical protein